MTVLRAHFCPGCGARLRLPSGREIVCEYCETSLWVEGEWIQEARQAPAPSPEPESYPEPPARLWQQSTERVEVSLIEQLVDGSPPEVFLAQPLDERRLALVALRITDSEGRPRHDWPQPLEPVLESLRTHGDPGLAANTALQWLADHPQGFPHRLECIIALYDPARAALQCYTAGCPEGLVWLDCENSSTVTLSSQAQGLERKLLRGRGEAFENCRPVLLGPGDSLVMLSPGVLGRRGSYSDAGHACFETLRELAGEDPLRIVTMVKNAYWRKGRTREPESPPVGAVRVAALQPLAPPLAPLPPSRLVQFGTSRFQLDLWANPLDELELLPLHNDRWVLMWISGDGLEIAPEVVGAVRERVLEIHDRPDHGDNDNPRVAGRAALEGRNLRLTLVLLVDRYNRVHYYRSGWQHPIYLAPRGNGARGGGLQSYDEGGSATVEPGARLFFLGRLPFTRDVPNAEALAEEWPGGKASRLYAGLCDHWKTPPGEQAILALARAALSDQPGVSPEGLGLITGKR